MAQATSPVALVTSRRSAVLPIIATVFFFSGFSSLIYEVIWMRRLALFLGGDVYSAAFTLSAFMGGLALGSLLASRYADRLRQALFWYGLLEICIGLYALFFPMFLDAFSSQYQQIYRAYFDTAPWRYHAFRILVATVTMVIPTTMMGSTLPLIVKHLCRAGEIGRYSGFFYSMNTCGALAGVLSVGFVLLPALGMKASTYVACSLNVIIGVTALVLSRPYFSDVAAEPPNAFQGTPAPPAANSAYDLSVARIAMIAIALSGFAALALEVVWVRILIQSFSATVYAFSIMLSCFLFGIFYGSKWISRRVDRRESLPRLLGLLEMGLGFCVASLATLTYFVPALFSRLLFHWFGASIATFGLRYIAALFIVSACLIIVPTLTNGGNVSRSREDLHPQHDSCRPRRCYRLCRQYGRRDLGRPRWRHGSNSSRWNPPGPPGHSGYFRKRRPFSFVQARSNRLGEQLEGAQHGGAVAALPPECSRRLGHAPANHHQFLLREVVSSQDHLPWRRCRPQRGHL
jgi:spermidine synthase